MSACKDLNELYAMFVIARDSFIKTRWPKPKPFLHNPLWHLSSTYKQELDNALAKYALEWWSKFGYNILLNRDDGSFVVCPITDSPINLTNTEEKAIPALQAALMWADVAIEGETNCFQETATEGYKAAYKAMMPWMTNGQNASAAALKILATAIRKGNDLAHGTAGGEQQPKTH